MTRQEQKEERKKLIMMTGMRLFVEKGFHETKVSDIAAAVPMSVGLMFHYFESKEELFKLRMKQATGSLENPARIRELRKTVARLKTILREREIEG